MLDSDGTRLLVLLLPEALETSDLRPLAEDLLRAPGVVAVDPPRASYDALARIPDALGVSIATKQARRLRRRLPGRPAAIAIFAPGQYPLARALVAQVTGCELWYGRAEADPAPPGASGRGRRRLEELHLLAHERASLTFAAGDRDAVRERLAALRVGR